MTEQCRRELARYTSKLLSQYFLGNPQSTEPLFKKNQTALIDTASQKNSSLKPVFISQENYEAAALSDCLFVVTGSLTLHLSTLDALPSEESLSISVILQKNAEAFSCKHIHISSEGQTAAITSLETGREKTPLERQLQEIKKQLRKKEEEIEQLTSDLFIGIAKYNTDGQLQFLSESCYKILHLSECLPFEQAGPFGIGLIDPAYKSFYKSAIDCLLAGEKESVTCQCCISLNPSAPVWISFGAKILIENQKRIVYCILSDITKIKQAELKNAEAAACQKVALEELEQKSHQMQIVLNAIQGGLKISLDDEKYTYAYVSDELCALFGYTKEEYLKVTGGTAVGAVYPPDLPRVLKECEAAFENGNLDYAIKYRILCKDGSTKWIVDSGRKKKNEAGKVLINSIYLDINELEKANQQIAQQRELLNSIYDSVMCGILRFRVANGSFHFISLNREALRLMGYPDETSFRALGSDCFFNRVHPDDLALADIKMKSLKNAGDSMTQEYRILVPNEETRWILGNTKLLSQPGEQESTIIQHMMIDVTEKKKLELALEEERQRFRIAIESAAAVVFEYDIKEDKYIAYGTLESGAQKHSLEGETQQFIKSHLPSLVEKSFFEEYRAFLTGQRGNYMELRMAPYLGSKELVWAKITLTPLYGSDGRVSKMIGKITNIQSEKEKEFALQAAKSQDSLTGLYTKEAGIRLVKDYMEKKLSSQICAMMLLDMDDFKQVNKQEGHVFGDAILQEVASVLRAETNPDDILIRLGGDEFMMFIKDCDKQRAAVLGPRIASQIQGIFAPKQQQISASIGMCVTAVIDEYSGLYRCAESTLKYVKLNKKGSAACYLDTSNELGVVLTQLYTERHFINEISSVTSYREEDLPSFALELLGKSHNIDDAIFLLLSRIGKSHHFDRVSILEVDHEFLSYQFTYQWAREKKDLEIDQPHYVSLEEMDAASKMYDNEGLCTYNLDSSVSRFASCLHAGIWNNGRYAGSLSFEVETPGYGWTADERKLIKELVKIFFSFIMKERADAVSKAKTDFLSRMSHEIRTPMNAISGMTTIAKSVLDDREKALDCLSKIESANSYLLTLINDILDMSRIESGKMELNLEPLNLGRQLTILEQLLRPQAEEKQLSLVFENRYLENKPILTDPLRLNQVFINIIGNAIKFTPQAGKIRVLVAPVSQEGNLITIRFSVADTGIGISPDAIGRIFKAFEQADRTTVSLHGGTGLGLSISNRLVQLMGGVLQVNSTLGKGSDFYFTLTFTFAGEMNTGPMEEEPAPASNNISFKGRRILIAEDNDLNLEIAQTLLEMHGFLVDSAENGLMAVKQFSEHPPFYYDAVLMDIRMPVLNGLEAAKRIRTMGRRDSRSLPIIAMTANAFNEDTRKSIESGMNAHLSKPIEIDLLLSTLRKCLST